MHILSVYATWGIQRLRGVTLGIVRIALGKIQCSCHIAYCSKSNMKYFTLNYSKHIRFVVAVTSRPGLFVLGQANLSGGVGM